MRYLAIIGVICLVGLFLLFIHLDNESQKARDTSNDGCINKLFIITLVGGLIAYVIVNFQMCRDLKHSDYEYYEPRHSD